MTKLNRVIFGALIAAQFIGTSVANAQQDESPESPLPRYHVAIDAELSAMEVAQVCETETETRSRCTYIHRGQRSGQAFNVHISYSDESDTIYFYVRNYLSAPGDAEGTTELLRRMIELNWQLLAAKFEWDPRRGEVRLGMIQHTDSNFDRRAFRSIVRQIGVLADRYYGELSRLAPSE